MPQETWRQGRPQRCLTKSHTSRPERFKLGATLYENGPVTEIEVFKFAEAVVIEVQLPSRQPGHVKSWVGSSRGVHRHARLFTPNAQTQEKGDVRGVLFTHSVGYSRPPSAVNDLSVTK